MMETMNFEYGIGLAAPQIGESIRLFVMDVGRDDPIDPEKKISQPYCFFNPVITKAEGKTAIEEGCLSCPELQVSVDRAARVTLSFLDIHGKPQKALFDGLEAICIQHEMDHLNGVLLVDQLNKMSLRDYERVRKVAPAGESRRSGRPEYEAPKGSEKNKP
jgi:peptide deformylase